MLTWLRPPYQVDRAASRCRADAAAGHNPQCEVVAGINRRVSGQLGIVGTGRPFSRLIPNSRARYLETLMVRVPLSGMAVPQAGSVETIVPLGAVE